MRVMRLVVTGTVGAGKTTLVQTISSMGMIQTERIATDATALQKPTTTVAFDFCRVNLNAQIALHIYGAPGQFRFNFMWDWLIQTADICLLLMAAHRPEDVEKTRQILSFIATRTAVLTLIGLTHTDRAPALSPDALLAALAQKSQGSLPYLIINPRESASVWAALEAIASMLEQQEAG